jgi:hypothetical protein
MHGGKSTGRPITHGLRTKKLNGENILVKNLVAKIDDIANQILGYK